jgi:hypothetical protein
MSQLSPAGHAPKKSCHSSAQLVMSKKSCHSSAQLAMSKKNHVTAPEPGQHHAKSCELPLQVHFSTSTLLQKIMSRHCSQNPDMVIGPILPKKSCHSSAELAMSKKIMSQLWRLAELGNCGDTIYFILKNPGAGEFCQEPDALSRGAASTPNVARGDWSSLPASGTAPHGGFPPPPRA